MPGTDSLVVETFACVWDALADSPAEAVAACAAERTRKPA